MLRRFEDRSRRFAGLRWLLLLACVSVFAGGGWARAADVQAASASATPATVSAAQQAEFGRARVAAEKVLARAEFQRAQPTWWDRLKGKIGEIIVRFFVGIDRVTAKSPWMGRLLEWLLFVGAAVGVLVWVLRTIQRQRLRVGMGGEPAQAAAWERETEDWRRLAESEAARGAWREAIHALYWAAIVHLEKRRAWRHNPSRTPREYVRLLKAGSDEQGQLRRLTRALEESWYGQREASEAEFGAARESFERLAQDFVAGGQA